MRFKGQELFKRHTRVVVCGSKGHATQLATIPVDRRRPAGVRSCETLSGSPLRCSKYPELISSHPRRST